MIRGGWASRVAGGADDLEVGYVDFKAEPVLRTRR